MERKEWNHLISEIAKLHKETKDERLVDLHNRVVNMALEDHEKQLEQARA